MKIIKLDLNKFSEETKQSIKEVLDEINQSLELNAPSSLVRVAWKDNYALRLDILERLERERLITIDESNNYYIKIIVNKQRFRSFYENFK